MCTIIYFEQFDLSWSMNVLHYSFWTVWSLLIDKCAPLFILNSLISLDRWTCSIIHFEQFDLSWSINVNSLISLDRWTCSIIHFQQFDLSWSMNVLHHLFLNSLFGIYQFFASLLCFSLRWKHGSHCSGFWREIWIVTIRLAEAAGWLAAWNPVITSLKQCSSSGSKASHDLLIECRSSLWFGFALFCLFVCFSRDKHFKMNYTNSSSKQNLSLRQFFKGNLRQQSIVHE